MRFLKTNTATRITVGPFIDKTDGFTPEVALTVTSEKLTLVVDDAGVPTLVLDAAPTASGGNNDMVHITNDDSGYYDLELAAANVNYVGRAVLSLNDVATHLPVFHEFMILSAAAYDFLFGTSALPVDVNTIKTQAVTCAAGVTVLASVGTAATSTAQTGDSYPLVSTEVAEIYAAVITNAAGADIAADIIAMQGNVTTIMADTDLLDDAIGGLIDIHTDVAAVKSDTAAILTDTGTTLDGRIPAALVSGRMDSSVGAVANNAITAAAIADAAIDNATFAADVGSTAFATNILALALFKALDSAITDAVSLTAGGLLEKVRRLTWVMTNKVEVTDATGNTVIYKDDNSTSAFSVNAMLTDDLTTTTRLRAA